ncbi:MAG: polyphosphate kinase 2 family protein [Verrucomicrobia bacterium]|nr:polyphosphate kinase 2 family protein [Verrucomicrobiota bacterium]
MKIDCSLDPFVVKRPKKVKLKNFATSVPALYQNKQHYRKLMSQFQEEIQRLQSILYAHNRYAVLLIFQGLDTAGKDGAIKHVMSGVNPQGCQVFSFKQPSSEELNHDFLWRTNKRLPERGRIGIFNRSYYEEVLIAKATPGVLDKQRLPDECRSRPEIWQERYGDINHLEDYLHRNGTRVVKFFLHISKDEQRNRFLERIDDPDKNWKLSPSDLSVRKEWDAYQSAYSDCIGATATAHSPWHVIPADDKKNARILVSKIVVDALQELKMDYPQVTEQHREELKAVREQLE